MLVATLAWAASEVLAARRADVRARAFSTAALVLALVHVTLAFHVVYRWDHEFALAETARQAGELTGWAWRGALLVNYAFLGAWAMDVGWWWLSPRSRQGRPWSIEAARRGVFLFMFINGAVIFAAGVGRMIGTAAVAGVIVAWLGRAKRAVRA
jgi:hypothetical protein